MSDYLIMLRTFIQGATFRPSKRDAIKSPNQTFRELNAVSSVVWSYGARLKVAIQVTFMSDLIPSLYVVRKALCYIVSRRIWTLPVIANVAQDILEPD